MAAGPHIEREGGTSADMTGAFHMSGLLEKAEGERIQQEKNEHNRKMLKLEIAIETILAEERMTVQDWQEMVDRMNSSMGAYIPHILFAEVIKNKDK